MTISDEVGNPLTVYRIHLDKLRAQKDRNLVSVEAAMNSFESSAIADPVTMLIPTRPIKTPSMVVFGIRKLVTKSNQSPMGFMITLHPHHANSMQIHFATDRALVNQCISGALLASTIAGKTNMYIQTDIEFVPILGHLGFNPRHKCSDKLADDVLRQIEMLENDYAKIGMPRDQLDEAQLFFYNLMDIRDQILELDSKNGLVKTLKSHKLITTGDAVRLVYCIRA